jgi:hypothetical protein
MRAQNIEQRASAFHDGAQKRSLELIFSWLYDRLISQSLTSAGLAIKAGGGVLVKTGATTWVGMAEGVLISKAAATDMPALVGTVVNATFNVFAFYVNSAGTVRTAMGTAGATLAAVAFPEPNDGDALIGFIVVNPTGTGNFVGGTTALDDVTVVPNVVYVNPVGAFDPTAIY